MCQSYPSHGKISPRVLQQGGEWMLSLVKALHTHPSLFTQIIWGKFVHLSFKHSSPDRSVSHSWFRLLAALRELNSPVLLPLFKIEKILLNLPLFCLTASRYEDYYCQNVTLVPLIPEKVDGKRWAPVKPQTNKKSDGNLAFVFVSYYFEVADLLCQCVNMLWVICQSCFLWKSFFNRYTNLSSAECENHM